MFGSIGPGEIIVIMALALLFFGPKKLPEIGKSIGGAMREFRKASSEFMEAMNQPAYDQEEHAVPVNHVEYPTHTALSEPENYEALPYGSDFYASEPADPDSTLPDYANSDTLTQSAASHDPAAAASTELDSAVGEQAAPRVSDTPDSVGGVPERTV